MKIESISKLERVSDRYIVLFDNGAEIKVSSGQIAEYGVYSGRELSDDDYSELCKDLELGSSKARALRILGSRSMSAREMEKRLVNKGESAETARRTVEWLEDIGAVNDMEYAGSIANHYYSKGYGFARIKDELYKRGIEREMWEEALSGIGEPEDAAFDFIVKKLRGTVDKGELQRMANMLCTRGFSYGEARTAVNRYIESIEEIEDVGL